MATLDDDPILRRRGDDLYGRDGDKLGKIEDVYLDAGTDEPAWAVLQTGLLGTARTFVPLRDASEADGELSVPYDKDTIKEAPPISHDGAITKDEEAQLLRHYGIASA